jgi:hypothetical protein
MPIAKLKYLVANGDLATGNFALCLTGSRAVHRVQVQYVWISLKSGYKRSLKISKMLVIDGRCITF